MLAAWGDYRHQPDEVQIVGLSRRANFQQGLQVSTTVQIKCRGILVANPALTDPTQLQNDLTAKITALIKAYNKQGQDFIFYLPDGVTKSAYYLLNTHSAALGGVRVTEKPSFDGSAPAHYTSFVHYSFTIEAEVPAVNDQIVLYEEHLSFVGTGGPKWALKPCLIGPPQKQVYQQITPCSAVQSGRAIGLFSYPTAPGPRWPADEHQDQRMGPVFSKTPEFIGEVGQKNFETVWAYHFERVGPFNGFPTIQYSWHASIGTLNMMGPPIDFGTV